MIFLMVLSIESGEKLGWEKQIFFQIFCVPRFNVFKTQIIPISNHSNVNKKLQPNVPQKEIFIILIGLYEQAAERQV